MVTNYNGPYGSLIKIFLATNKLKQRPESCYIERGNLVLQLKIVIMEKNASHKVAKSLVRVS